MERKTESNLNLIHAAWQDVSEVCKELETSEKGLSIEQAEARKSKKNQLWEKKEDTIWYRIRRAFFNPFTGVLLFLACISYVTNHWINADEQRNLYSSWILLVMVFISGGIRLSQEMKSRHATEELERLIHTNVHVKREGILLEVAAEELVPGDCVYVTAGSRIPADLRLMNTQDLFLSQAAVSGESAIVEKNSRKYTGEKKSSPIYYPNLAFMGTTVISGKGEGIVLASGRNTLYGRSYAEGIKSSDCFEKGANSIAKVMLKFMFVLVPIVFAVSGIIRGNWLEAFLFAVSVAVGLMPEMLPMVITACLAKGSLLLSKKKTLIKNMNSMQGFGSMDVLCIDKTGTITNETIILEYYMDILGNESGMVLDYAYLNSYYHSGIRNPIDAAVLKCYEMPDKQSYYETLTQTYQKKDEVPFDYERKCVSVLVEDPNGHQELILKGEPDAVLKRCDKAEYLGQIIPIQSDAKRNMDEIIGEMLEDGMKVIAVAKKDILSSSEITSSDEGHMILLGYLAFFDAPKSSAKQAIKKLSDLKVKTKILTGDRKDVTLSICRRVGMDCSRILTGQEIENLEESQFQTAIEYGEVFAELTPNQKVEIIKVLRENGHTVGFLGDGMNDVPAICEADVGISVDTAVDAAKDAADVVLLAKDLNVLEEGILEGRKTFINMSKYIRITASSNFGNIFSIVCASAFLPFLPMTAIQLLLLNLLYDTLCMVLPWDCVDPEDYRKPREWSGKTLGRFMRWFGPISSAFDILTFLFLYFVLCPAVCGGVTFGHISDPEMTAKYISVFQTGWFLESMWSQILILQMLRTSKVPFIQSKPSKSVTIITLLGIVGFSGITVLPLGKLLGLTMLPGEYFGYLLVVVLGYMFLTNLIKRRYVKQYHELI